MTYTYEIGDGAHAIDQQLELDWKRGYQVANAASGSNLVDDNGTNDTTIRVQSGDINFGGTVVTCSAQTLDLSGEVDANDPRKVTVYRDSNGDAQYSAGTPEPAQPAGATRADAYRPAPPTLSGTDAVVCATVWIAPNTTDIDNADIRDRRQPADLDVTSLETEEKTTVNDSSTDPSSDGEIRQNAADVKIHSGGAVRNVSNIGSGGGGGIWTEDGNSPFTVTGANSISGTLASDYDQVLLALKSTDTNGNGNNVSMQVNGDTGSNYDNFDVTGAETSGASSWPNIVTHGANITTTTAILVNGFNGGLGIDNLYGTTVASATHKGSNFNVSAPLDSFTFDRGAPTDFTVEAFGRDIA